MALTSKQAAFLDAYLSNPLVSMAALARAMSIPVDTVYGWKEKNIRGFADEMEKGLRQKWDEAKHMASETIFSLARDGDFKAAKYILDYSGYAPAQKIEADLNSNTINISIREE